MQGSMIRTDTNELVAETQASFMVAAWESQASESLQARGETAATELTRFKDTHFKHQPVPDYIDTMFEFSIAQPKTEAK
jgi:hypothetical protein